MSNLLFAEHPLVVNPVLARIIGLNEAIVLQQIHYWIEINRKTNNNHHDGRYWTYNAMKDWHEKNFNFWSFDTVKRTFASLERKKLLISSTYNSKNFDRKKWYAIDYEALESLDETPTQNASIEERKMPQSKSAICPNGAVQNAPMEQGKMPQPIAETTTESTTEHSAETTTTTTATQRATEKAVVRGAVYKYCEKYLGLLSTTALQKIGFFLDQGIQPAVIQLAVDASVDNNVRSWKYTSQILHKCLDHQCFTAEQYQKRDMDFKNTQQHARTVQPQGNQGGNPFLQRARELMALQETQN